METDATSEKQMGKLQVGAAVGELGGVAEGGVLVGAIMVGKRKAECCACIRAVCFCRIADIVG